MSAARARGDPDAPEVLVWVTRPCGPEHRRRVLHARLRTITTPQIAKRARLQKSAVRVSAVAMNQIAQQPPTAPVNTADVAQVLTSVSGGSVAAAAKKSRAVTTLMTSGPRLASPVARPSSSADVELCSYPELARMGVSAHRGNPLAFRGEHDLLIGRVAAYASIRPPDRG